MHTGELLASWMSSHSSSKGHWRGVQQSVQASEPPVAAARRRTPELCEHIPVRIVVLAGQHRAKFTMLAPKEVLQEHQRGIQCAGFSVQGTTQVIPPPAWGRRAGRHK